MLTSPMYCARNIRRNTPEMFVTSYSVTYCIYVPGKPGVCFHYYCAVYDECNYSDMFWLADRTRLFVQYTISLSSLCNIIWRHWNYKMSVRYILSSVWVRLSIFSPCSIIQYVGLYVFSLPISVVMMERIYILCLIVIIKSEVWTITHCLGLGHETMVSAVCLSIFLLTGSPFPNINKTKYGTYSRVQYGYSRTERIGGIVCSNLHNCYFVHRIFLYKLYNATSVLQKCNTTNTKIFTSMTVIR